VKAFKGGLADLYEPGSTFKPLNVAIALEWCDQSNSVFSDPDVIKVGGWSSEMLKRKTTLSVAEILQYSSNVGGPSCKESSQQTTTAGLGLKQTIGIDLPSEVPGQLKSQKQFIASIEAATASFGRGFSHADQAGATARRFSQWRQVVTPHVGEVFDSKGQPYWQPPLPAPRQIFSPKTTQTVVEMMKLWLRKGREDGANSGYHRW